MPKTKKKVEVTIGRDFKEGEFLIELYKCPDCGQWSLTQGFNFCPSCGVSVTWIDGR